MDKGWYFRFSFFALCAVFSVLAVWPSIGAWMPAPTWVQNTFQSRISPGLDIKGGLRLMYEVEVEEAIDNRRHVRADQLVERLCQKFEICTENQAPSLAQREQVTARVRVESPREPVDRIKLTFNNAADIAKMDRQTVRSFGDLREVTRSGNILELEMRDEASQRVREDAVQQARETIADRIDELGLREASVLTRENNIIIELPGSDERQFDEIRQIVSRTARLEFKVVDDAATFVRELTDLPEGVEQQMERVSAGESNPNATSSYLLARGAEGKAKLTDYIQSLDRAGRIPDARQLAVGRMDLESDDGQPQEGWRTYTLHRRADVTGDGVSDAMVSFDPQTNNPEVSITFDAQGGALFERLTGENIKKRMAIVLDDRVESAPVIQARIGGGRARITLGGGVRSFNEIQNEANQLVVVLRAGALPAPIRPANEQFIGPTLGLDSVRQGAMGALIGIGFVLLFMGLYYEVGGIVANIMVLFNLLFLFALMATLNATITLPGIAGIALTVGMAVDANVLINERIREELKTGKTPRAAVENGFDRAFWSIVDSQLTTAIAGVVLWQYGTGPLKGFAVTLLLGIVTSLFTGVFCSKILFDYIVRGLNVQRLRVG